MTPDEDEIIDRIKRRGNELAEEAHLAITASGAEGEAGFLRALTAWLILELAKLQIADEDMKRRLDEMERQDCRTKG